MRKKFSFFMIHLTMLGLLGYLLIHSGLAGRDMDIKLIMAGYSM